MTEDDAQRINITAPTAKICQRLGLDPADVALLEWTPGELSAVVFKRNEAGNKYVDENGNAAKELRVFKVRA